jgi:hypothetical protein
MVQDFVQIVKKGIPAASNNLIASLGDFVNATSNWEHV